VTKKAHTVLLAIGILILVCYAIAGIFCHPVADDFSYASLGRNDDFLLTVLNERQTWNGRYFSNFFVIFSPLNWGGLTAYKLMSFLLICFIFFGTSYFFKLVIGRKHIILALVSTVITFSIMPDIAEGIYWYTGAWTYIPSAVLFFIGLSLVLKFQKKIKWHHYLALGLLFIITSGFNEIIPLLGISIFSLALFMNRKNVMYLFFLVLFITLLLYMLTAPGNAIRGSYFPNKNQLLFSLISSGKYSIRFISEWLVNPAILLWGIILLKMNFDGSNLEKLAFLKHPIFIIAALIIPTYICCFGPIWSTGSLSQPRTANLACYLFLPIYTLVVVVNKKFLLQKLQPILKFRYTFGVFLIFFMLWKNHFYLFKELLNGDIVKFNSEMHDRYERIKACEQSDCYVPEIKTKSKTLFVVSLDDSPDHWINQAYQNYFDSGKIIKTKNSE
jgi:hypothetical protein